VIWVGSTRRLSHGMVLKPAVKYQRISTSKGVPRDNH
jgi:dihydroxy-acid dehydratase